MSERKGHGNRGSLMDLAKPRLAQTPLSGPLDQAERLILSRDPEVAPATGEHAPAAAQMVAVREPDTEQHTAAPPPVMPPVPRFEPDSASQDVVAKLRKKRQPIAVVGFKLPASLKDELSAVAQYNSTDMTRIVVEALERFLPELPHPPDWR